VVVALVAAAVAVVAAAASAQIGASVSAPLRHEIDARCNPLDRLAEASRLIFPIGEHLYPGDDATGTYAHVLERGGTIAAVYLYTTETQTRGEVVTRDCYRQGRLQRMRTEYVMRSGGIWTRTKYFGDDGSFLTQSDTQRPAVPGGDTVTGAAPRDEPVYRTLGALPFYRSYLARRGHVRLPRAR
jgi:hypothetical protein